MTSPATGTVRPRLRHMTRSRLASSLAGSEHHRGESRELSDKHSVAGLKIARRIVGNPALDRYRAFEMNPGDQCQRDDDFLDYARRSGLTAFHVIGT